MLKKAKVLATALEDATDKLLENRKGPSRKAGELDNRGSHFYIALYWANALASQNDDTQLKAQFAPIAEKLATNEDVIVNELNEVQGKKVNIGGYYMPDDALTDAIMKLSQTQIPLRNPNVNVFLELIDQHVLVQNLQHQFQKDLHHSLMEQ
jgi:isocitrate dehydrogenase